MLRANSRESELVVMTLPLPRRGATSPALYTAWLDIMTKVSSVKSSITNIVKNLS